MVALIDGDIIVYSVGFGSQRKGYMVDNNFCKHIEDAEELARFTGIEPEPITSVLPEKVVANNVEVTIDSILREVGATDYKVFLSPSKIFRNSVATLLPYKGNRKKDGRPKLYSFIRKYLISNHDAIISKGEEADDMLGKSQTNDTVICSNDKDLLMIPGKHYNISTCTSSVISEREAWMNFFMQVISGDRIDNVPGLHKLLMLKGKTDKAKRLAHRKYLKRIRKLLDKCSTEKEMKRVVNRVYRWYNIDSGDVQEIADLIWIRRNEQPRYRML